MALNFVKSTDAQMSKQQPFRFLALPPELRNMICLHAFGISPTIQYDNYYASKRFDLSLLRVSRQVNTKASAVFRGAIFCRFTFRDCIDVAVFKRRTELTSLGRIRNLHVTLLLDGSRAWWLRGIEDGVERSEESCLRRGVQSLTEVLQGMQKLQMLQIMFRDRRRRSWSGFGGGFEDVLDSFTVLKDLKRVMVLGDVGDGYAAYLESVMMCPVAERAVEGKLDVGHNRELWTAEGVL